MWAGETFNERGPRPDEAVPVAAKPKAALFWPLLVASFVEMLRIGRRRLKAANTAAERVPAGLEWFWEKYHDAVDQIIEFCDACAVTLDGREVADVGCGEGSMALGLCRRAHPQTLIGFDVKPTSIDELCTRSAAIGAGSELPPGLEFRQSAAVELPVESAAFDFVYSWSAFEHIADPIAVLEEVRRVLRPGGHFFLQLWPFYLSAKGSHLWQWFDQDFHHLFVSEQEVLARMAADERQPKEWTDYMAREFQALNRITVEQLQRVVLVAGFDVARVELLSSPTMLSPALARYSWSDLAISGIKLLACRRR